MSKKKYFKELSDYLIQKPSSPLTLKAQQVEAKSEAPQIHNATLFNVNNHFMHELRIVFSHHFPDNLKGSKLLQIITNLLIDFMLFNEN